MNLPPPSNSLLNPAKPNGLVPWTFTGHFKYVNCPFHILSAIKTWTSGNHLKTKLCEEHVLVMQLAIPASSSTLAVDSEPKDSADCHQILSSGNEMILCSYSYSETKNTTVWAEV